MVDFKIGADPEFFLLDTETGKHVSAFNMVPGTKHDPFEVEGGAVQVDGMALEFNINPASTFPEFEKNIGRVLKQLREMVPARYKFDFTPVAHFGQEYIDSQPDEAKALGCDPDFNAWDEGAINPKPDGNRGIRTASGHIHIGWTQDQDATDPEHIQACIMLTKQLDYYLGNASLLWDTDSLRRSMYGAPGAFRPKRYGVEYRVLSNLWVDNAELRSYVYHMAMSGAQKLMAGKKTYNKFTPDYIDWLFNYANWSEIRDVAFSIPSFTRDDNFRALDRIAAKNAVGERPERVNYDNKMKEGYFLHISTNTFTAYEDVDPVDFLNDLYKQNYYVYREAKIANLPKPEWKENEKTKYQIALDKAAKGIYPGPIKIAPGEVYFNGFGNAGVKKAGPVKGKGGVPKHMIIDDFAGVPAPPPQHLFPDPFQQAYDELVAAQKKNGLEF